MSTIRTLRKLTRMAQELEVAARALSELGTTVQESPLFGQVAQTARQHAPAVKGHIERITR